MNWALSNNKMQLTSGGLYGALRAPSSMRRLQLILVFDGPETGTGGTVSRVRPLLVLGAGFCALTAIVTSSLDRDAYFYYRHQPRPPWEYPLALVLAVALATIAETGVAYAVFAKRRAAPVWKAAFLSLLVLVPWGLWLSEWVIHSPGFWMLHLIWVWLLIAAIASAAVLSLAWSAYRSFRRHPRSPQRAVEQADAADEVRVG